MKERYEEYMKKFYRMEITEDPDEGGYVISFPDLPGCISEGETIDEAVRNALDAKEEWMKAALEDGYEIPEPESLNSYSGQYRLRMPKSLHRSLALHSRSEGVSMNQYCVYLLSKNDEIESEKIREHRLKLVD